ncbi:MAG: hypothetical protein KBD24_03715 [Candidatus Pacebacteria bacterium]|nr:hypothetical protein [Candidatus Paceibacterota bacterium]
MIYTTIHNTTRLVLPFFLALWLIATPVQQVHASSYMWGGQQFNTQADMYEYIREYTRIHNELYGVTTYRTTTATIVQKTARTTTTSSAKATATQARVSVRTRSADSITFEGARLTGTLDRGSASSVKVWFEYGTDSQNLWFSTVRENVDRNFGSKNIDRKVTNLIHDTTYYYRIVAEDAGVRSYGAVSMFTTAVDVYNRDSGIRVSTGGVQEVKDNRATLTGSVSFDKVTSGYVWFEYSDEENDLYKKSPKMYVSKQAGDRTVSYSARNLNDQTTYYVRMVGYDMAGLKNYGATYRFTTPVDIVGEKPKTVTEYTSEVSAYTATLKGSVDMNDFNNGVSFFVYGEDQTAVQNVSKLYNAYGRIKTDGDNLQKIVVDTDLDGKELYSVTVINLDFKTTHYYAIGVEYEDDDGNKWIVLGNISSFTTKDFK